MVFLVRETEVLVCLCNVDGKCFVVFHWRELVHIYYLFEVKTTEVKESTVDNIFANSPTLTLHVISFMKRSFGNIARDTLNFRQIVPMCSACCLEYHFDTGEATFTVNYH